jgi:hypothetical protein
VAAKLTRLIHKIAIKLHLVAESCTICSSRSRRPVRKLLYTHSYTMGGPENPHGRGGEKEKNLCWEPNPGRPVIILAGLGGCQDHPDPVAVKRLSLTAVRARIRCQNSVRSSRAIIIRRWPVMSPRNVASIQTPDVADRQRRFLIAF